jgi:uncharacterized membrane-anchored protein YhcB (DUF1043 family)
MTVMTILIAWASLSVGIVIGAVWKSLCEKQLRSDIDISAGSVASHRLNLDPQHLRHRPERQRPAC